jgi:predicted CoA-binding protein
MNPPGVVDSEEELARIVRTARTVAVLGMKDESSADAAAYRIPVVLRERGLRVIPVNPRIREALGEPSRPDVAAVGEAVDILDVFRRSEHVAAHVDEILRLPEAQRPRVVWMQTGVRDDRAAERLAAAGLRVVMDLCLGVYAARYRSRA